MRLLLDTCTISEVRNPACPPAVRELIAGTADENLFLSVITLGEIQKGISLLDPSERQRSLQKWLSYTEANFADRILPVDQATAAIWGEISAKCQRHGHTLHTADGLIAATAIHHGLHVVTRNIADFEPVGVLLLNPWAGSST